VDMKRPSKEVVLEVFVVAAAVLLLLLLAVNMRWDCVTRSAAECI